MKNSFITKKLLPLVLATGLVFGSFTSVYADETEEETQETQETEAEEASEPENDVPDPVYTISIEQVEGGRITIDGNEGSVTAKEGEKVFIDVLPDEAYEIFYVCASDEEGEEVEVAIEEELKYSLIMPDSNVTLSGCFLKMEEDEEGGEEEEGDTDEIWYSRSIAEIDALFGGQSSQLARLSTSTVTGYVSGFFYGGATASLKANGQLAYCILPWSSVPNGVSASFADYSITSASNANHQLMGKILYYGYGGAGNILTGYSAFDQEAITHFALAYVWMINMGNSYGLANPWQTGSASVNATGQALVMNFLNSLASKPAVKGTLHLSSLYTASGNTYQDVAYGYFEPEVTYGYIKVQKSFSTAAAANNSCYTLAGAKYGVYKSEACTGADWVTTLTTDETGNSNTARLTAGTYYVKEGVAPEGAILDRTVYKVTITTNHTSTVPLTLKVKDAANMDPIGVLLKKLDKETGEDVRRV